MEPVRTLQRITLVTALSVSIALGVARVRGTLADSQRVDSLDARARERVAGAASGLRVSNTPSRLHAAGPDHPPGGSEGGFGPPPLPTILLEFQEFARAAISGERGRAMVAAMDPSYRVPGNRSFNEAIHRVVEALQAAGYREEGGGGGNRLTYRLEERELPRPTWEPVQGVLEMVGDGAPTRLMDLSSNINLIAANSHSTPSEGLTGEVVYVGRGGDQELREANVEGKIVLGDGRVRQLFRSAVQERGALGVLAYGMPAFNRPEENLDVAPMGSVPYDSTVASWGMLLSRRARDTLLDALRAGPVTVRVVVETRIYSSTELTLVAEVRGNEAPEERFVLSAHVQESGANDNASGVAAQAEVARALAEGVRAGRFAPRRTVTFLWGDEIRSTRRFLEEDPVRAAGVRWGLSLDMVGEDTEKTGGTFLIEKMPDPSAVWTRGEDRHTEWGGRPLGVGELTPHYLNDFVLSRCQDQAEDSDWEVRTNPYEGGSDHVPFLNSGTPGVLFWHFTDQYYHTDGDRVSMVSPRTLWNVGVCAAVSAMALTSADPELATHLVGELEEKALNRLATEHALSRVALTSGGDPVREQGILEAWTDWYMGALRAMEDLEVGGASARTRDAIQDAQRRVEQAGRSALADLGIGGLSPPRQPRSIPRVRGANIDGTVVGRSAPPGS